MGDSETKTIRDQKSPRCKASDARLRDPGGGPFQLHHKTRQQAAFHDEDASVGEHIRELHRDSADVPFPNT